MTSSFHHASSSHHHSHHHHNTSHSHHHGAHAKKASVASSPPPSHPSLLLLLGIATWEEFGLGIVSVLLSALVSVIVGVAAGIALSVQSMDPLDAALLFFSTSGASQEASSSSSSSSLGMTASSSSMSSGSASAPASPGYGIASPPPQVLFHHSRITIGDPYIARHNSLASGSDPMMIDGSRISSMDRILMLVEKSPPLLEQTTLNPQSFWQGGTGGDEPREGGGGDQEGSCSSEQQRITKRPQTAQPPMIDPPMTSFEQYSQVQPSLCSDGETYGYDRWDTLIKAFQEANSYSTDRFMRWNKYFATTKGTIQEGRFWDDPRHYYDEDIVLTICPNAVLRGSRGPLAFVNAENIVLECDDCAIHLTHRTQAGSHFSFGPHAKNIWIRGVTFRGATSTSLLFHYDGAEVSLEDCFFENNMGTSRHFGTVADVNSTSVVNFYRCLMNNNDKSPSSGTVSGSSTGSLAGPASTLTSLSIRARDMEL